MSSPGLADLESICSDDLQFAVGSLSRWRGDALFSSIMSQWREKLVVVNSQRWIMEVGKRERNPGNRGLPSVYQRVSPTPVWGTH